MWETQLVRDLRHKRMLRLHGFWIGLVTLAVTWGSSALQLQLGVQSLALRYLVSLGLGYLVYLLILRWWAAALIRRDADAGTDVPDLSDLDCPDFGNSIPQVKLPTLHNDGGGATADFSGAPSHATDALTDLAGDALSAAASSDEAAVVVVPVVAIFLIGCALVLGAGSLLMLYFGWDALLAVAVELSFSYAAARVSVGVERQGWVSAALRVTWKPLAGAVLSAVVLGACIDHFLPTVHTLPQALHVLTHHGH
jgi:hypothetical protein